MVPGARGTAAEQVVHGVCYGIGSAQLMYRRRNEMIGKFDLRNWRLNRLSICIFLSLRFALLRVLDQSVKLVQAGDDIPFGEDLLKVHAHACAQSIRELLVKMSQAIGNLFGGCRKA